MILCNQETTAHVAVVSKDSISHSPTVLRTPLRSLQGTALCTAASHLRQATLKALFRTVRRPPNFGARLTLKQHAISSSSAYVQ